MLFVEGNHVCPTCEKSGNCQLQAVAYYLGMLTPHFNHFYPPREVDASHPDVVIDFNRCILCELCVRASRDVDGKNVFGLSGRGGFPPGGEYAQRQGWPRPLQHSRQGGAGVSDRGDSDQAGGIQRADRPANLRPKADSPWWMSGGEAGDA